MKRSILMLAAAAFLMGGPAFADMTKHDDAMCKTHCNIMELQKQVDALKKSANSTDKLATKEHLKKDIADYEKKLEDMKAELNAQ